MFLYSLFGIMYPINGKMVKIVDTPVYLSIIDTIVLKN